MAWRRPISRPRRDRNPKSNDEFLLLLVIYLIMIFRIYLLRFFMIYLLGILGFIC